MMKLFDDIIRAEQDFMMYSEPRFRYLNRSARPEIAVIRKVLEDWFSRFPPDGMSELRKRFQSTDDPNHLSAFFELFLNEILLRLGCKVSVHPRVSSSSMRAPDFFVESPSGGCFYLEAVLATDESREDSAAKARMNMVYDKLNEIDSPVFFIGMELRGLPKNQPCAKDIRSFVQKCLATINPDEIKELEITRGQEALPRWIYEGEGWKIEFFPILKSRKERGRAGVRPFAVHLQGFSQVDPRLSIRDAIIKKASRYGDLDLPYVVAVNALSMYVERTNIMEALFGQEPPFSIVDGIKDSQPEWERKERILDGAWTEKSRPRYKGVSAVLIAKRVTYSNVVNALVRLYHNPWASRPYNLDLSRLPQGIPQGHEMISQDGESLKSILSLPHDWPEKEKEAYQNGPFEF